MVDIALPLIRINVGRFESCRVYFNMVCVLSQVDPPRTYTDRYSVLFMRKQGKAVPRVERA